MTTAPRSPGWYPAPNGGGEQWWNGVAWSESRRDGTTARRAATHVTPAAAAPAAPVTNITPMAAPHAPAASNITPPAPYAGAVRANPYAVPQPHASQHPAASQAYGRATTQMAPASLAALITGIASIFINIAGPIAIILGVRALSIAKASGSLAQSSRAYAIAGIALGVVGSVVGLFQIVILIVAFMSTASYSVN